MSEHDIQAMFFEEVAYKYPAETRWMHAIPNGGARNVVVASKMKQEGTKRGIWDVCLPLPRGGFHGLYIEFKFGKGRLTPEQKEFGAYLQDQGYKTGVAYTVDEAMEILEMYLKGGNE